MVTIYVELSEGNTVRSSEENIDSTTRGLQCVHGVVFSSELIKISEVFQVHVVGRRYTRFLGLNDYLFSNDL